ncbi:MAG TPA: 3-hydroxyacyl-CoA dehydrogenase NAD-binding domain-containing protein [Casimicrobiaceae bacterium]|nr:3-hydroxyacyl-CoA dehydrogenase NAD-binding domain-containing protein [Casimicrobiaceae bacterium]
MAQSHYEARERVALIGIASPPVNGLSHDVRRALVAAVDAANADANVDAIVITGNGKFFSAGADVREFNTPRATAEPTLRTLIEVLEASPKPVIAAINGTAMGGGLELALGCHFRVAVESAPLALPEVRLGLIPGAGGTQRLPRAIGVEKALNMIVSGASVPASQLADAQLLDKVVATNAVAASIELAKMIVTEKRPRKRLRDVVVRYPNAEAFFKFASNTVAAVAKNLPAPARCVEAVGAAATMPIDEGLRFERRLFLDLVASPESKALRHAFFAERSAARIAGLADDIVPRRIERVGIVGAGTMGAGIATAFASAGLPVTLVETNAEALEKGVATIRGTFESAVKRGRLDAAGLDRNVALVRPSGAYDDLREADLIIEAVFEDMAVKQEVFATLDRVAKPGAILATNTSTLDVNKIASVVRDPSRVIGLHFFSPANVMKLLEVVRADRTADDVLATAMAIAKRISKTAVVARVCDGFIGNRMIEHYLRQAMFLLDEGASPRQVDAALEGFGMAMGPFRMGDLAGLDVGWRIRQRRYVERPQVPWSRIADRLCEQGRFGQKTGAGFYRYEKGRRDAIADPAVDALISDYRREIDSTPRKIAPAEIVDRCILALVNEGARLLDEGIAQRASDIDVVYLTGYGFPVYRGGPMFHADTIGLYNVVRRIREFAQLPRADATFWTPAPLLARLAESGGTFNESSARS